METGGSAGGPCAGADAPFHSPHRRGSLVEGRSLAVRGEPLGGHASTATTEQVYGHLLASDKQVSEELDQFLWPAEVVSLDSRRRLT